MIDDVTGQAIPLGTLEMGAPEGRFYADVFVTLPPVASANPDGRLFCDATGTLFRLSDDAYVQASPDGEFIDDIQKFLKLDSLVSSETP